MNGPARFSSVIADFIRERPRTHLTVAPPVDEGCGGENNADLEEATDQRPEGQVAIANFPGQRADSKRLAKVADPGLIRKLRKECRYEVVGSLRNGVEGVNSGRSRTQR